MEIEDGVVQTTRSKLNDIAFLVGIITYCIIGITVPILGIFKSVELIKQGAEIANSVINPIGLGLIATAVNIPVGFSLLSFPIANIVVFGNLQIAKDYTNEQKQKFDKVLSIALLILICFMVVGVLAALYAIVYIESIAFTSAIIFITLQALGLLIFVSGAVSLFFYG